MSLNVVTGAMGCGKTADIFEKLIDRSVREPDRRFIVIVPEQATLQTEKRLIAMHPKKILFNIEVISFNRLAANIFDACSLPIPLIIDEVGKSMLLRRCIQEHRQELNVYAGSCGRPGFLKKLKVLISELLTYGVDAQRLAEAAERTDDDYLKARLGDISIIHSAFCEARDEMHITSEELLPRAFSHLADSGIFSGAYVVFDGFAGFTPVQFEYIGLIIKTAQETVFSFTLPGDEKITASPEPSELFYPSKTAIDRIMKLAEHAGIVCRIDRFDDAPALPKADELVFLEKNVLRTGTGAQYAGSSDAVRLCSCLNPAQELAMVTHEIKRLVREGGGRLHYRDIAVVAGALNENAYIIKDAFNKAQIPYYIDAKTGILGNPLTVFTLGAIDAAVESFSYRSVFRYLRSGFSDVSAQELDELENYVLGTGIKSFKRWSESFKKNSYKYHPDLDMERLNDIRERAAGALISFKKSFSSAKTVSGKAEALRQLYETMSVSEKLMDMSESFRAAGDDIKASEYRQVFDCMEHILGEYEKLLGDEVISAGDFRDVLVSGLSEKRIGVLPARLDEVQIGDIRRSRRGYVKVLFFIDLNDGIVPASPAGGGMLSDEDRELLSGGSDPIELAPSELQNSFDERFHIYELVSSPTELLYLACSRLDMKNSALKPSVLFKEIAGLFKDKKEMVYSPALIDSLESPYEGLHYLSGVLCSGKELDQADKQLVSSLKEAGFDDVIDIILDGAFFFYGGDRLSAGSVEELYGKTLHGSVSSLETFEKCPYSYFLKFGLKLRERDTHEFSPIDRGNYFHTVLEHVFREYTKDGKEADADELTDTGITMAEEKVAAADHTDPETGSGKNRYLLNRWKNVSRRLVHAMLELQNESGFRTEGIERKFDRRTIPLSDGGALEMSGRIDRYDVRETAENRQLRIIDYKSSGMAPDPDMIRAGISMQLPEYLSVALEEERKLYPETKAEGIYYYNTSDTKSQASVDNDSDGSLGEKEISKGLTADKADLEELARITRDNIADAGSRILSGEADIRPYYDSENKNACTYCPYINVCGFDRKLPGYNYRRIEKEAKAAKKGKEIEDAGDKT